MKTGNDHYLGQQDKQQIERDYSSASLCGHTCLLTERPDLKKALQCSFRLMHLQLKHSQSLTFVKTAIMKKSCDVAIIDLERRDIWPGVVFADFDRIAADFPIIMLCSSKDNALDYIQRAENTVDIFSYDVVYDPRFGSLVHAAKLRAEARNPTDPHRGLSWMPLSAA